MDDFSGAKELVSRQYVDQRAPLLSFVGTGSPEGKITAPVGAVYTDTEATNGAIRWVKTSGTGSTGWRVEYGDTGWRDITGSTAPGITTSTGYVGIRRVGNGVNIVFDSVNTDGSGSVTLYTVPLGFRPGIRPIRFTTKTYWSVDTVEKGRVSPSGAVEFIGLSSTHQFSFSLYYLTTSDWPATLPGTPA